MSYLLVAGVGIVLLLRVDSARAQPANDSFAGREVITSLPFGDAETDIAAATVETTDPRILCRQIGYEQGSNTVWYSYTTGVNDEYIDIRTRDSDYDTLVAVFTGSPGSFKLVSGGCNDDGVSSRAWLHGLRLRAQTTYSIVVARPSESTAAATLNLWIDTAPVYSVSKTADTADGACDLDCSLREAIQASNAQPGAIVIPAGTYVLTRPGADDTNVEGDLDVRAGMGIYGAGVGSTIIDAGALDRVVDMPVSIGSVHVNGLTLTNGSVTGSGGGLRALGNLDFITLEDVAITNNRASTTGGGLAVESIASLRRVTVNANQAGSNGGGAVFPGTRTIDMRDSAVTNNRALNPTSGGGGGIHTRAALRLNQVTISRNSATTAGGGLLLAAGTLIMRSATVIANVADVDNNDTNAGGGIRLSSGSADIANSVIANNYLDSARADLNDCLHSGGTFSFTRVHLRVPDNCLPLGPGGQWILDPGLAPLPAGNGGATATHAILSGSPLIDSGDPSGCRDSDGELFEFDQRGPGFPRARDGDGDGNAICDRGAYEFTPAAALEAGS
jgi:CSLREA domain-containing protein